MRSATLIVLAATFGWGAAYAQNGQDEESLLEQNFAVQRFEMAPAPGDFLTTEGSSVLGQFAYSVGLLATFQHNPLTVRTVVDNRIQPTPIPIVKDQTMFQLGGAFGFGKNLQASLVLPVILAQNGDGLQLLRLTTEDITSGGLGDLRLGARYAIGAWDVGNGQKFSLAAGSALSFPFAQAVHKAEKNDFLGERSLTFTPKVIAEFEAGAFEGAANLAYRLRPETTLLSLDVDDELLYSVAGRYQANDKLSAILELFGGVSSLKPAEVDQRPLELDGAVRYLFTKGLFATGGLGLGITPGAGAPKYRVFAAVGFTVIPKEPEERDHDSDGIPDKKDQCPEEAEDKDGDQDEDGCYDAAAESVEDPDDEDADDVKNALDQCPSQPEDNDDFQDEDGCPDPDNDQDSILDHEDKCWDSAEDKDGFEDEDGCPDLDNDQDKLPDDKDACPDQAEDMDSLADDDGCPDQDADKDGLGDETDSCPAEAEKLNGIKDDDGCPDEGESSLSFPEGGVGKIQGAEKIRFQRRKVQLESDSIPVLNELVARMRATPNSRLIIRVAPDRKKSKSSSELASQRVEALVAYLTAFGVEQERISAEVGGEPGEGISLELSAHTN